MNQSLINEKTLAERWGIKPMTLSQWRWNGRGPKFMKIGRKVLYRLQDVETFELERLATNTAYKTEFSANQRGHHEHTSR